MHTSLRVIGVHSDSSVSVILALGFGGWTSPEPLLHDRTHRPQHLDSQPVDCQRPVFGSCFDQVRDLETPARLLASDCTQRRFDILPWHSGREDGHEHVCDRFPGLEVATHFLRCAVEREFPLSASFADSGTVEFVGVGRGLAEMTASTASP